MVVANTNDTEKVIKTDFYQEILRGAKQGRNVMNDETVSDLSSFKMPAQTAWVIEVK